MNLTNVVDLPCVHSNDVVHFVSTLSCLLRMERIVEAGTVQSSDLCLRCTESQQGIVHEFIALLTACLEEIGAEESSLVEKS